MMDGFVAGEPAAIRTVDGWIDTVLIKHFQPLRGEWEDIRQETRTRLLFNLQSGAFNGHARLRTYVHRVAANVCIDTLRKSGRRRESPMGALGDPAAPGDRRHEEHVLALRVYVSKLLEGLSERNRRLLDLVLVQGLSLAEVAQRIGVSESAVKSRMFRCKNLLIRRHRKLSGH